MTPVDALFEEFVSRWTRDEPVDLDGLLERAGSGTDELARLIDAFLERAPRRTPSAEAREAISALVAHLEQEPPLLAARVAGRRRVRDLTPAIVAACDLPAEAERLVRSYYQRLEGGLLDPRGVSDRVWAVLEAIIGPAVRNLALKGYLPRQAAPAAPTVAFQRVASTDSPAPLTVTGPPVGDELPEEVRRKVADLFTGADAN